MLDRLLITRLERKSDEILGHLEKMNDNWEEVMHHFLFKHFGSNVNGHAMSELSRRAPLSLVRKVHNLEALLFGQAGMLESKLNDRYYLDLQKEYIFLRKKWGLIPMKTENWKYSKLRPSSFPTIRIAQLACLSSSNKALFSLVRNRVNLSQWMDILKVSVTRYWCNHYLFGKASSNKRGCLGEAALKNIIIINVVVPIAFAYGRSISENRYKEYSIELLHNLSGEQNKVTRFWNKMKLQSKSAYSSQALLELHSQMCIKKECLNCRIGNHILIQENRQEMIRFA